MLQLRTTRARIAMLLGVLVLLAVIAAVLVLSHAAINAAVLPDGAFGGH